MVYMGNKLGEGRKSQTIVRFSEEADNIRNSHDLNDSTEIDPRATFSKYRIAKSKGKAYAAEIPLRDRFPMLSRIISSSNVSEREQSEGARDLPISTSAVRSTAKMENDGQTVGASPLSPIYDRYMAIATKSQLFQVILQYLRRLKNYVLQIREYQADPEGRRIRLDLQDASPQLERLTQKPYISNSITSSRYTIYNFLPRQLMFQFSKIANIYFLAISILQMIPGLSTTGTYTTIIPLAIFVSIAMAREGYDDIRRHRMDTVENRNHTHVLRSDTVLGAIRKDRVMWAALKVGDIIQLEKNEWVPADILLLDSTEKHGVAYLETAALDGETNLKCKRALPNLCSKGDAGSSTYFKAGTIISEAPNANLYHYHGKINIDGQEWSLNNEQIIYRGSILRNTSKIFAVVLFTGEETKIRLNSSKNVRTKRPLMQSRINRVVVAVVGFVLFLATFCTCGYYLWRSTEPKLWYLERANSVSFLPIFIGFLILFNTMVPLSLYVSMEIVKLIQQILLQADIDLYHEQSDTPAEARTSTINEELGQITHIFSDKTGTLTDNEMVFRRLTVAGHAWIHDLDAQNENTTERPFLLRKLRKHRKPISRSLTIDDTLLDQGNVYSSRFSEEQNSFRHSVHAYRSRQSSLSTKPLAATSKTAESRSTLSMLQYIATHPHTIFARRARLFLLSIALCHTALPEYDTDKQIPHFSAASPDELALVNAAHELGFIMTDRDAQTVTLSISPTGTCSPKATEVYQIHDVIEFSSARKRMSIIVEFPDGRICILCKGADSFLLDRLRLKELASSKWEVVARKTKARQSIEADRVIARKSMTRQSISRPSTSGRSRLDTIRDLDEFLEDRRGQVRGVEDYASAPQYPARHSYAFGEARSPLERATEGPVDEQMAQDDSAIFEATFQHLHSFAVEGLRVLLYGHRFLTKLEYQSWRKLFQEASTSLHDRQHKVEQVAELIETNLELTGATAIEDKLQEGVFPAIEKLHRAGIKLWMLTGDKSETAVNIGHSAGLLKDYSTEIILSKSDSEMAGLMAAKLSEIVDLKIAHAAVIIDGETLAVIEGTSALFTLFMQLVVTADTVICCRASPAQKASLIKYVRKQVSGAITLAIGDGANDIAMIREAHVGIGITGKEGFQAARSSDYSIAQFRFLVKLLLVHGRWNYIRISKYVLATFYKELLLFLTQAVFQRFAGYTGTSLHENWALSLFNTLFSSLAVIIIGGFEKDLSAATLLAVPELYETSRLGKAFGLRLLIAWALLAITQAVVGFYLAYFTYGIKYTSDLFPIGNMLFTAIVVVINVKLIFLEMHNWSVINFSFFAISFCGWWTWLIIETATFGPSKIYFVKDALFDHFGRDIEWWAGLFLTTSSLLVLDLCTQALRASWFPTEEDCFREMQTDAALKSRLEEEAALELQAGWIEDLLEQRTQNVDVEIEPVKLSTTTNREGIELKSNIFVNAVPV